MYILYNLFIYIFLKIISLASLFNTKIRIWHKGRIDWEKKLIAYSESDLNFKIWFHCASLGEYEQGKPVMQEIKKEYPQVSIVVTFFSPSGYEARKNSELAQYVGYLPADSNKNATDFVEILKPKMVFFVKSEIWPNFISAIKSHNIPLFLISARFFDGQSIFKNNRSYFRNQLRKFDFIFVQDKVSQKQLKKFNIESVLAGDTRFDQVLQLISNGIEFPIIEKFKARNLLLVVGSCWMEDIDVLTKFINEHLPTIKILIAPHDVEENMIASISNQIKVPFIRYSELLKNRALVDEKVLILDSIGILANAYKYADVAFIGGAFKQGLHNILEPAINGIPVIFGPNIIGFNEASEMLKSGGAFTVSEEAETIELLVNLFTKKSLRTDAGEANKKYMLSKTGATEKIMVNAKMILFRKLSLD